MPRSASLRNYFELLPRDLTRDYIRQVLCSQSKGAEGNEVLLWMVCWSAPAAEWSKLQKWWISFWNFRWQSNRKSSCQPHTWLLSGWPLCKNCEVSKPDLEAVILVWTSLISMFSASARAFAADELNFISNISLNLVIFEFEPYYRITGSGKTLKVRTLGCARRSPPTDPCPSFAKISRAN